MTSEEVALAVVRGLEQLAVPYMIVGSFSSNFYGIPRSTRDADFVAQISTGQVRQLAELLGPSFRLDAQMAFETVTGTTKRVFSVADTPFTVELFDLSDDPHDQARFQRRQRVRLATFDTWLPTAEDVIVMKLRWAALAGRSKDRDDVREVMTVQADRLDWPYVESWCDRHGTRQLLDEIRRSVPPI